MASVVISRAFLQRVARVLVGAEYRQQRRLRRSLMGSCVCLVAIGVLLFGMASGFVPAARAWWLIGFLLAGLGIFYVLLRSGWNLRTADPGLTFAQMAFAVGGMTAAYALAGPARGGFLVLLACAMVFGAFAPRPARLRLACALSLSLLAAVMALMAWLEPERYPARTELIHFVLCAIALPTIAAVAGQLSAVRGHLRSRNQELADALSRIHLLATRDELTGLANRRHMRERLAAEHARMKRVRSTACLCLVDLDHFKRVNDQHGHAAGDAVLRAFSEVATRIVRQSDAIARWGGEEFLWLLPDTQGRDAHSAVERLRGAFSAAPLWLERPELRTTFSAGLTQWLPSEAPELALERSDSALYQAKSEGRDRSVFAATTAPFEAAAQ
jgi:diguanylate cyclase (GGDEF)-like protein